MGLKTIFFCGHKSQYGIAHIEPILSKFQVCAVIVATNKRWENFYQLLNGKNYNSSKFTKFIKNVIRFFKKSLIIMINTFTNNKDTSIEAVCFANNVTLIRVYDVNEVNFVKDISEFEIDIILSAAYPQIFSKALLSLGKIGAINFHPSLLPRCRGAHPHFWSIASGETTGGISAHFMTENIDDGDIIAQISFPIEDYYYNDYCKKMINETPQLVKKVHSFLNSQGAKPIKQNPNNISYFRNDRDVHRRIFWNITSCKNIYNLIRTERAFCFFKEKKMNINRASIVDKNRNITNNVKIEPGTIIDINDSGIVVATIDHNLYIVIHSFKYWNFILPVNKWIYLNKPLIGQKFF